MSWNYRVVKQVGEHAIAGRWEVLAIHEVYYDDKNEPLAVTENPSVVLTDENLDGLKWQLDKMREALDKPVLDYDSIGEKREKPTR